MASQIVVSHAAEEINFDKETTACYSLIVQLRLSRVRLSLGVPPGNFYLCHSISCLNFLKSMNFACLINSIAICPVVETTTHLF